MLSRPAFQFIHLLMFKQFLLYPHTKVKYEVAGLSLIKRHIDRRGSRINTLLLAPSTHIEYEFGAVCISVSGVGLQSTHNKTTVIVRLVFN